MSDLKDKYTKIVLYIEVAINIIDWDDYIIQGVQGELYPCKPDIFEATYEKVED